MGYAGQLGTAARRHVIAEPAADAPLVELRSLSKSFEEGGVRHVVLDGVSERLAAGSFTALLGRSGTGKSTLLNLISGIESPDSGEVLIGGRPIHALDERQRTLFRRRHVGFVFQFFNLIPTLTVAENLLLPLELLGRDEASARAPVAALLEAVGLADRGASYPDRLSGGEQQRVAVARAVVHEPTLVLADEPTGNLDADSGAQVLDLLERLAGERRKTLLLATHSREVAARAGRVLRIRDHRLVEAAHEVR